MPAGLPQTPKRSLFDLREFDVRFSGGNRLPKTSSAHFLRKSAATKLFRPISSGNRPPQNFFGPFPQEIGRHKTVSAHFLRKSAATKLFRLISSGNRPPQTFSAHFLRKSAATNFFGSFPQEIAGIGFHSFPQEIAGWASTHFLRKSLDGLPLISSGNRRMAYIELTLNQKPRPQTSVNRGWRRGFPYAGLLR